MAATKKGKKLTQRQKAFNASMKKQLQEEGIIPPNKPRLNRKKFAQEVHAEWEATKGPMYTYIFSALAWMTPTGKSILAITPEQIGALKVMKIALEQKKFEEALEAEGIYKYDVMKFYSEIVRPIIEL